MAHKKPTDKAIVDLNSEFLVFSCLDRDTRRYKSTPECDSAFYELLSIANRTDNTRLMGHILNILASGMSFSSLNQLFVNYITRNNIQQGTREYFSLVTHGFGMTAIDSEYVDFFYESFFELSASDQILEIKGIILNLTISLTGINDIRETSLPYAKKILAIADVSEISLIDKLRLRAVIEGVPYEDRFIYEQTIAENNPLTLMELIKDILSEYEKEPYLARMLLDNKYHIQEYFLTYSHDEKFSDNDRAIFRSYSNITFPEDLVNLVNNDQYSTY